MAGGMATMLLCTLLFSCNNEDFLESGNPEKACDNICFGISSDKNVQTRGYAGSDDEGYTADRFVLRSDDSADTLCVRAIVSDGINVSGFEGEQALTRATPVGKDNFYDKFHVLAYWSKNSTPVDQFYMNTNASNVAASVGTGAIWSTEQIYYWPGADHSFQFYAWAPTDAGGLTTPSSPQDKSLAYTVPEAAADQKDIVVATTNEIQGDNNAAVPLTFKHICTAVRFAVRFAVGSQMQPGSIKSVALKGVKNTGTYDMATGTWALAETTKDFSQDDLNKSMTGNEIDGTEITSLKGTFMMLPQTLPAGATVEVVFVNANNEVRTLTAPIGNTEWKMGTTVTYKLSITPEYELEFVSRPEVQDAHYVIVPITVNAKDLNKGNYTIKVSDPTVCKLRENLVGPEVQGYWPKETTGDGDFTRKESISSNNEGETVFYAFLTENATNADRDITLELQYNGNTIQTLTILQKYPNWIGDMGWEHFEEDDPKPFGFAWTRKVTYKSDNMLAGGLISLLRLFGVIQSNPAVSFKGILNVTCTIDYSAVPSLSNVFSEIDGLANTKGFRANSASDLSSLENTLSSLCTITSESGENINSVDFAALVCIKKNACNVEKQTSLNGQVAYLPSYEDTDIKWYLPAIGQFSNGADLSGQYWSSTAINDNANAYSWNSSSQSTPRMNHYNVRAVRQKP